LNNHICSLQRHAETQTTIRTTQHTYLDRVAIRL